MGGLSAHAGGKSMNAQILKHNQNPMPKSSDISDNRIPIE